VLAGAAIYCEWETDASEWRRLQDLLVAERTGDTR